MSCKMYSALVPLNVAEGYARYINSRSLVKVPERAKDWVDMVVNSKLPLDISSVDMEECMNAVLPKLSLSSCYSILLHYSSSKLKVPDNMRISVLEFLKAHLEEEDILDFICSFEKGDGCVICNTATTENIINKLLSIIDLQHLLSKPHKSRDDVLVSIIKTRADMVTSLVRDPDSLSSPILLRSALNKDNQMIIFHLQKGNLRAVKRALCLIDSGVYVVDAGVPGSSLYDEIKKSKHAVCLFRILTKRASFRTNIVE